MTQAGDNGQGVGDRSGDLRHARRDDRDTLASWRSRMHEGKEAVVAWLDEHAGGPRKYAETLKQLRVSTDDRVRLGALKIEAQLREWFGDSQAVIDARVQTVNVTVDRGMLDRLMANSGGIDTALDALDDSEEG